MPFGVLYCENPLFGQLFEPLNTVSNIFFFASAVLLLFYFHKQKINDLKSKILVGLIFLIGIGSFIWHLFPTKATFFLDTVPISVFFLLFFYFLLEKLNENSELHQTKGQKLVPFLMMVSYLILQGLSYLLFSDIFLPNGRVYIITLIFLFGVSLYAGFKRKLFPQVLFLFLLFLAAFVIRQLDLVICPFFPLGTHFAWHALNAFISYYGIKTIYGK